VTDRPATPATPILQDHPLLAIKHAFSALEGLAAERPELASEHQRAIASLQDLAWIARSRIFDGRGAALRRALERASIAASIVSVRRADASPMGPRRLRHALSMFVTTTEESLAMLARAGTHTSERGFSLGTAQRPQHVAAESIDAAEGPLDRAA
jgi:hypothetical protein